MSTEHCTMGHFCLLLYGKAELVMTSANPTPLIYRQLNHLYELQSFGMSMADTIIILLINIAVATLDFLL